jgi:hypothetical protein
MAQNKFRAFDEDGNEVELSAVIASLGAGDALKIVSTGADGRLDISLIPPVALQSPARIIALS